MNKCILKLMGALAALMMPIGMLILTTMGLVTC